MEEKVPVIEAHSYTAADIDVLSGLEPVRLRPAMYVGNTSIEGLHHLAYEIIDNSIDEHLAGFCTKIIVRLSDDCLEVSVKDNGRGIPVDTHKKTNTSALEVIMTTLHAGGKFNDKVYKVSGGLHGVGASVVVALSKICTARVFREGKIYQQTYSKGYKTSEVSIVGESNEVGTEITFSADPEIFHEVKYNLATLYERLKERAYLNPGLEIEFHHLGKIETLHFVGGLTAFVEDLLKKRDVAHNNTVHIVGEREVVTTKRTYKFYLDIAFRYTKSYQETLLSFANNINTVEGGTHVNAFKNALLKTISEYIARKKLLADLKNCNPVPRDVSEGLVAIVSVKMSQPEFEGQTKTKLGTLEIRNAAEEICREQLEKLILEDSDFRDSVIAKIVLNIRARDAAAKARSLVGKASMSTALSLPITLTDCTSRDRSICELFLCEGESASGTLKTARNKATQAVLPLKGVPKNTWGLTLNKTLENEEIQNIFSSLGIDFRKANESCEGIRYSKIVQTTDADPDGGHILSLLLAFYFKHARSLITNGLIYVAKPPLFKATFPGGHKFLLDDQELTDWKKENSRKNFEIKRYKGLGENSWQELAETVMNESTRTLIQCTLEDAAKAEIEFNAWVGADVAKRKQYLFGV
jgi:DNA gyrase subunit B